MAQSADSTCLCEICIGGPGEYYCQQCDQLFCGNCKLSHLRAKISKNHTFFSGQNINKEEKRLCIEHEERFLFYCHDCDTPVCSSCSVQTHKGHLMNDLTKSAVKLKFELIKIIESTITTSTSCIGKIEKDTKTYHQKTKAVNKTITEEGNYYKEFIDKKVHSFVKLVQDETQKALGSMSTATKVYLEILENCQQWQKNITEMETKSDVLLYKKLKHLKTDVDQIVSKQSLDTPRPSVSYTNKILSDTDIDNLFGELTFQIRNAEPDETSCLTTKSLENTIKDQKKLILEIQKRLIQLQNALNEAEQATKETKIMLNNCREDKNAVKSTLLERELENDKLHFEEEQLNQRLKMQKEHAEEQIDKLKKKLKEKEKDLQQSKQINDELNKNLVEIERNRTEFTVSYSSVGGFRRSDTEKENISLKTELTVALDSIEKLKQEYSDLSEKYETGMIATKRTIKSLQREKDSLEQEKHDFRAKLDQIQSDVNRCKNEQVHQQDSSHETIENLLQQNSKLDKDRGLLRTKIFSLENDKVKLEDALNKSKEDNKKLQREQDNLQDILREKSNELKDSEVRLKKFEANILFLQNTKIENEKLKESLHEIEKVKREFEDLEKRYKRETSDRISSDNISSKYKEENDRLRKERNSARIELQRVLREKNES